MKRTLTALSITAALLVTGCATNSPAEPTVSSVAPTVAAATTKAGAATSQFASVISEREQDWRDYVTDIPKCVKASYDDSAIGNANQIACGYTVNTIGLTAKVAARDLRALGEPPAELASLLTRTVGVLELIRDENAGTICDTGSPEECANATMSTNLFAGELTSILDAWKPYTS